MKNHTSKPAVKFLVFLFFLIIITVAGTVFSIDDSKVNALFDRVSIGQSAFIFILLYTLGAFILCTLKEPLKIVGAVVFGPYVSTLLIYISEIINATVFFKLSRVFGKDFVEKKAGGDFKKFYNKVKDLSLIKIIILRANPLFPYRLFNVSFGLSRVSFKKFLLAVVVASPFRIFWLQFPLAAIKDFSLGKMTSYFQENSAIALAMSLYIIGVFLALFFIKGEKSAKQH